MYSDIRNKENETENPKKPALTKIKRLPLVEIGNLAVPKAVLKTPTLKTTKFKHVTPRVDCRRKTKHENEKYADLNALLLNQEKKQIQSNAKYTSLFLVNDYADDIYNYLFELENCNTIQEEYLKNHVEITHKMRTILIDWLCEIHTKLNFTLETYLLTVTLVDIYLQKHPETLRKDLQLVGCTAFLVATKYEEVFFLNIKECINMMDRRYTAKQMFEMEKVLLQTVNYQLGQPLSIGFLRRFSKAGNAEAVVHLMGKYFIELVSIEYSMAHLKKSLIAGASLYLAIHIHQQLRKFNPSLWTTTLERDSKYSATDLQSVSVQIIKLIINAPKGHQNKYRAIYSKYSMPKNEKIAKKLVEPKAKEMLRILIA